MSKDTSGPAFPLPPIGEGKYPDWQGSGGMSLRDYFAAAALQGLASQPANMASADLASLDAKSAYAYADAMLAEREK